MDTIVNIPNSEIYISYGFTDIRPTGQSINKIKYKIKKHIYFYFSIL